MFQNKTVKSLALQKSDGLLPTCKSTLLDLVLPLMAYLAFLWVDGAFNHFWCFRKLAKALSPVLSKYFRVSQKSSYILYDAEFCC
jgi:hypothetical protein